jgi:hypothetical protein
MFHPWRVYHNCLICDQYASIFKRLRIRHPKRFEKNELTEIESPASFVTMCLELIAQSV